MPALFVMSEILIIETAGHKMAELTAVSFAAFKSQLLFFVKYMRNLVENCIVFIIMYVIFYLFFIIVTSNTCTEKTSY